MTTRADRLRLDLLVREARAKPRCGGDVTLLLEETQCLRARRRRFLQAAGQTQDLTEVGHGHRMGEEVVGAGCNRNRLATDRFGLAELARAGQGLRPYTPPARLGVGIL